MPLNRDADLPYSYLDNDHEILLPSHRIRRQSMIFATVTIRRRPQDTDFDPLPLCAIFFVRFGTASLMAGPDSVSGMGYGEADLLPATSDTIAAAVMEGPYQAQKY